MCISVTPYSSVGYFQESDSWLKDNNGDSVAKILKSTEGSGEVSEVKFGVGWEIFKGFSFGASAQYYWGSIIRSVKQDIYPILNPVMCHRHTFAMIIPYLISKGRLVRNGA